MLFIDNIELAEKLFKLLNIVVEVVFKLLKFLACIDKSGLFIIVVFQSD